MKTVNYYEIVIKTYHNDIVARIRFTADNEVHETALYSLPEINNILTLWRMAELQGSFAIGYKLADNANFQFVEG